MISDVELRRWLALLRRPDRLGTTELADVLRDHGVISSSASNLAAGEACARFLRDAIERLRRPGETAREQQVPHVVLKTCFVDGAKLFQAANRLGMSERQLSRERAWAISLLRTEVESALSVPERRPAAAPPPAERPAYRAEPIPVIGSFVPRPQVTDRLETTLATERLVVVAGPAGIGKTSLVAEIAAKAADAAGVFWYRFRSGVNDSLGGLLYELGEALAATGTPQLADYIGEALPAIDNGIATRIAIRSLDGADRLLVFDDYHLVDSNHAISGFLDDAVSRLPRLRVVVISRHRQTPLGHGGGFDVPVLSRRETKALLKQLDVDAAPDTVDSLHEWTNGVPQLVNLAAAWLKTATDGDVQAGLRSFSSRSQVQAFLLETITELLDEDDRAILDAASVFRGKFSDDGVAAVAGSSRGAVADASTRLVRSHVATRSLDGACAFFHTSVREYVYDRLSPAQRRALHTRAAEWFAARSDHTEAAYHQSQAQVAETAPPVRSRGRRAKAG